MPKFWFATSVDHPALTVDDRLAADALRASGADVAPLAWGDVPRGMRGGDVVVVRSCWDYHLAPARFRAWLDALDARGVRVANGVDRLRWNMDKRYLLELGQRHGIPIPPTLVVRRGERYSLDAVMRRLGASQVVVKPAISLSAFDTQRYPSGAPECEAEFHAQCARHDVLVQAYLPQIEAGEHSIVFFDNRVSHAVLKTPAANDFRVQAEFGGLHRLVEAPDHVVRQASRVLAATGAIHAYARVDGVLVEGRFVLMELELIDPVLFFGLAGAPAVERFTRVLQAMGERQERVS